jgi:tRNA(Ile)-lysidine synthase
MIETILPILKEQCGLEMGKPVVAGVSGGPDSLCLLDLLHRGGYRVIVAHFNHRLRPEADREADAVSELAGKLGLPFASDSADVHAYAGEQGLSLEEASRLLRYRFLFACARRQGAQAVAVGHTADDQVETVLMHFLRGAGLSGLKGMQYRQRMPVFDPEIPLIRPLLSIWRTDTEAYCRQYDLGPHFDASNSDQRFFRNRLRHTLIPELEGYNPRIKEALLHTALALQGDHAALQEVLEEAWKQTVSNTGPGWVTFDQSGLSGLSPGLQRNLIRRAAESVLPENRDIGFTALQRAADFINAPKQRRADFINGLTLFREAGRISLAASQAELDSAGWPQVEHYPVVIERETIARGSARLDLGNGWGLTMEEFPRDSQPWSPPADNWSAFLDADLLPGDALLLRSRLPGDAFTPLGMGRQTVKLREFFINEKIPRRARSRWPVLCEGEQIVWVAGCRIAHPYRVTETTRRILHLEIKKLPHA